MPVEVFADVTAELRLLVVPEGGELPPEEPEVVEAPAEVERVAPDDVPASEPAAEAEPSIEAPAADATVTEEPPVDEPSTEPTAAAPDVATAADDEL